MAEVSQLNWGRNWPTVLVITLIWCEMAFVIFVTQDFLFITFHLSIPFRWTLGEGRDI